MSMEELLEKVAQEIGVGCSGESDSDEYGIARDILKRFLLPLLEAGQAMREDERSRAENTLRANKPLRRTTAASLWDAARDKTMGD